MKKTTEVKAKLTPDIIEQVDKDCSTQGGRSRTSLVTEIVTKFYKNSTFYSDGSGKISGITIPKGNYKIKGDRIFFKSNMTEKDLFDQLEKIS